MLCQKSKIAKAKKTSLPRDMLILMLPNHHYSIER